MQSTVAGEGGSPMFDVRNLQECFVARARERKKRKSCG